MEFALLKTRLDTLPAQRDSVKEVMLRFSSAPAATRALARVLFLAGRSGEALRLLDDVRGNAPESLEDLELRVRILLVLHRVGDASNEVRRYGQEAKHHGWDFAVLAGRLALVAGPDRTRVRHPRLLPPGASRRGGVHSCRQLHAARLRTCGGRSSPAPLPTPRRWTPSGAASARSSSS